MGEKGSVRVGESSKRNLVGSKGCILPAGFPLALSLSVSVSRPAADSFVPILR